MGQEQQDNITFHKGMIPQLDPINAPDGTYLDALNMMRNEVGIPMNECGMSIENIGVPEGYVIVGIANLEESIVICSTNNTNSEIGILEKINGVETYTVKYNNSILKFNTVHRVGIEYKVDYTGSRIIYIAGESIIPRKINLDSIVPIQDFDKLTGLFLKYQLPITTPVTVASGGKVLTGIYQFGVRLVTVSNEVTGFGTISDPIPVSSSTNTANRKTYDGAPQGTVSGNSIQLVCTNIDTSFSFIEPCVITYVGEANILKINSLGKISINGRTSISFNYSGSADEGENILVEEVSIDPAQYTSAKYIAQKDNTLLLAGLKEEVDTFDWQSVANSILVSYETETIEVVEPLSFGATGVDTALGGSFNDYKNPIVCATKKTYKRDEVYSFTFTPISTSGARLDSFHIPAWTQQESAWTANLLGIVYTTANTYPVGFPALGSGTVLEGTRVRYHKMPSNTDAPFIGYNSITKNNTINILSLKFSIGASGWEDKVSGYIISRESRIGKETIVAQGIVKDVAMAMDSSLRSVPTGKYIIPPLLGDTVVQGTNDTNIGYTASGVLIRDFNISPYLAKDINLYYSPDTITAGNVLEYTPTKVRRVMSLLGGYSWTTPANENLPDTSAIQGIISPRYNAPQGDSVSILNITPVPKASASTTDTVRESENNITITNPYGLIIYAKRTLDCFLIKTGAALPNSRSTNTARFHFWNDQNDTDIQWQVNNVERNIDLYELLIDSLEYYGDIYNKELFPIKTVLKSNNVLSKTTTCYGGDIFISKYALTIKDTLPSEGSLGDNQTVPKSDLCVYFYVESVNNYNYRHSIEGSVTYFPKEPNLSGVVLGTSVASGHCEQYNKQYSAQNTIQKTYTENINAFTTGVFDNSIIYSQTSIEGEQIDAFTLFLPSNYHDIPKQYGSITGMFALGNDLYVHAQRALWKTFYNSLVTQATSIGEVVLGNGGAFSRPSVPIVALPGGYAGCKDISASVATPGGRYFYDSEKSKLYLLGDGLQEISNPAVFNLLRSTIGNSNVVLGYDYGRKRILLSSSNLTLSFKPELQSFDSRHSYSFEHFISNKLKDYIVSGRKLYKFDVSNVGSYFGNPSINSTIKFSSVIHPNISKRYLGIDCVITATDLKTDLNDPYMFFKSLKAYSRERNTGKVNLITNPSFDTQEPLGITLAHKVNNKFRLGFGPDLVDDISEDIHSTYNLKTNPRFTDEDRLFLPDMIDNHLVIELEIDNTLQKQLKIQSLMVNFDQNIT